MIKPKWGGRRAAGGDKGLAEPDRDPCPTPSVYPDEWIVPLWAPQLTQKQRFFWSGPPAHRNSPYREAMRTPLSHCSFCLPLGIGLSLQCGCLETRVVRQSFEGLRGIADAPRDPDDANTTAAARGTRYAIQLRSFAGHDGLDQAFAFSTALRETGQIPGIWFINRGEQVVVYAGALPPPRQRRRQGQPQTRPRRPLRGRPPVPPGRDGGHRSQPRGRRRPVGSAAAPRHAVARGRDSSTPTRRRTFASVPKPGPPSCAKRPGWTCTTFWATTSPTSAWASSTPPLTT